MFDLVFDLGSDVSHLRSEEWLLNSESDPRLYVRHPDHHERIVTPRILVADDDDDIRSVIAAMLAADGMAPMQAADGETALTLAMSEGPDLAILDVMMPGYDGWAVCQQMRQELFLSEVPVIILTSATKEDDELRSLALGADLFLAKPASRDVLLAAVHDLL